MNLCAVFFSVSVLKPSAINDFTTKPKQAFLSQLCHNLLLVLHFVMNVRTILFGGAYACPLQVDEKETDVHTDGKSFGFEKSFYHSAISKHVVRPRIVVEMGSHPTKRFL